MEWNFNSRQEYCIYSFYTRCRITDDEYVGADRVNSKTMYKEMKQWSYDIRKDTKQNTHKGKTLHVGAGSGGPGRALWTWLLHKSKGRYSPRSRWGQAPRESVIPTKAGIHFNYWKSMDSHFCGNDCLKKTIHACGLPSHLDRFLGCKVPTHTCSYWNQLKITCAILPT